MRRGSPLSGMVSLGCALAIVLTGCKGKTNESAEAQGGGIKAAGPPPGGWPQPENGRITQKMCGLLTDADYAKFGHQRLPSVSQDQGTGSNAVTCLYMTSDELTLNLQPTAESAKIVYADDLKDHKERLASDGRQSILATNVVPGADESWFDYWTIGTEASKMPEHELRLRRGSLLVNLVLSGIKGKNEQDPRTVLSGLAALVLQRIPDVGKVDTGTTHKVTYQVTGKGRAKEIDYADPTQSKIIKAGGHPLPWKIVKPVPSLGDQQVPLTLSALAASPMAAIGCRISVDGKIVTEQEPRIGGFASCLGDYNETK